MIVLHKVALNRSVFSGMIYALPRRMKDIVRPPSCKFMHVSKPPTSIAIREVVGVSGMRLAGRSGRYVTEYPFMRRVVLIERNVHRFAAVVDENTRPSAILWKT